MDKDDEAKRSSSDRDEPLREGEVLGLGGSAVPKAPSDPVTEFDEIRCPEWSGFARRCLLERKCGKKNRRKRRSHAAILAR